MVVELQPLKHKRGYISLSGLKFELIALGGENGARLFYCCEKYLVSSNKWVELPRLNQVRYYPRSVLLPSRKTFCFCGRAIVALNSIEWLQMDQSDKWTVLPLNDKIAQTYQLAAASF